MLKWCLTKKESTLFCPNIHTLSRMIHYFCFPALFLAFLGVELTKFFSRPCGSDLPSQKLTPKDISERCLKWLPFSLCVHFHPCAHTHQRKDSFTRWIGLRDVSAFLFILQFQGGPSDWRIATIWGKAISNFNLFSKPKRKWLHLMERSVILLRVH